ncbi:MAG: YybS family protein [Oligoflexia bacterium]|nr:YybS family protein [Oligoflexia bacterium]
MQNQNDLSEYGKTPWAFQLALALLGPLFYLSYLFTIFAPLPILYLHRGAPRESIGRIWSLLALPIGLAVCFSIKGVLGCYLFFTFAWLPAFVLGECFRKKYSPEASIGAALAAITALLLSTTAILSFSLEKPLLTEIQTRFENESKAFVEKILTENPTLAEDTKKELTKIAESPSALYQEIPGFALSILLLLCTLPCIAMIRWNPKGFVRRTGIGRDFIRRWRSPEWLVWPTLVVGALLIWDLPPYSIIAQNLLKPLLLIYFFQGMSILAFFLDSFRLRGPVRVLFYGSAILFLTPMVVSFGFFDLWFNFRNRRKPKNEDKEL